MDDDCRGAGGDESSPFHTARETEPTIIDAKELESMSRDDLIALQLKHYEKEKVIHTYIIGFTVL